MEINIIFNRRIIIIIELNFIYTFINKTKMSEAYKRDYILQKYK